MSTNWL